MTAHLAGQLNSVAAPWTATLSETEHRLISYFIFFAGLALFAAFIRAIVTRGEVGARFRPAVVARLCITGVAFASYVLIAVRFTTGYDLTDTGWVPNNGAIETFALRYTDWSVTVPLLVIELLAVCTLAGEAARRTRWLAMSAAFLMIFTGFLGAIVVGGGESVVGLVVWGLISCVFWMVTNVVMIRAVRVSIPYLTTEAAGLLRTATVLLLAGWVIYPAVYLVQIIGASSAGTAMMQIVLCIADVVVKLGFGSLIHRVAKLRTAEDVRAGDDVHPEAIWISSVKQSDAGQPREVYLARGAEVHVARSRPPVAEAIAAPSDLDHPVDDLD